MRPVLSSSLLCVLALAACGGDADHPAATPPPPPAPTAAPTASAEPAPTATATATASAAPAAPAPASGPPGKLNVLLLTIDSLRADMPWNGYERDIAPNLTAFAKKAVNYTHAYSVSSYTAMSVAGFLGSRYPGEMERSGYFFSSYPDTVLFFPELLQKAGVRTLAGHAHFYFDKQHAGFHQGFDVYDIVKGITANNKTDENITSPQHVELAQKILANKANTDKTFFAWFHLMDPHDEYMAHAGIGPYGKTARDKYDAEVTFTDQHVGKLLEFVAAQPWGKDTAIIVSSDHGEAFKEHKMWRHGFELYEMLVRVPLLVYAPGITPRRIDLPRSAVDLAPTILELTGTPAEPSFAGKSLVPELYGKDPEARDVIVDLPRTSDNDRRRALIHMPYKIIAWGDDLTFEFFDIAQDPGETKDIKKEQKAAFEEMKQRYKDTVKNIKDRCPKHTEKLKGKGAHKRC
ncbi:Sulfatase [Minicystis rosea]|nr:Sulfatase [Minicystis rosea]